MTPYYEFPESAWLFQNQISQRRFEDKKWSNPEEAVRQWCIHELIRSYGVRVDCIEIERHVKVARERRPHRIDVVVLRDGSPYVVVECKSRQSKTLDAAMKQAENYGRMPDIAATYAVATNGDQWIVHRRIHDQWLPVPELPDFRYGRESAEWSQILLAVNSVSPVLYWLDSPVPAMEAPLYFHALQQFFYARNEITGATDRDLLRAADNLLRVLSNVHDHEGYTAGKMAECCKGLNRFWKAHATDCQIDISNLWTMAHESYTELHAHIEDDKPSATINLAALRLILALLDYLRSIKTPKRIRYVDIPSSLQQEVRAYINMALILRFNAALSDRSQNNMIEDIHEICKPAWEHFKTTRNGQLSLKDHG